MWKEFSLILTWLYNNRFITKKSVIGQATGPSEEIVKAGRLGRDPDGPVEAEP